MLYSCEHYKTDCDPTLIPIKLTKFDSRFEVIKRDKLLRETPLVGHSVLHETPQTGKMEWLLCDEMQWNAITEVIEI